MAICCRPKPDNIDVGPCTWPNTDCYENGPGVRRVRILPDDEAVVTWATFLRRGWRTPQELLGNMQRYVAMERGE